MVEKATHTGTLDPMAEGVVIVLTDKDRFKKTKFSDCKKTYKFQIIFGISTDSNDLLGLQTEIIKNKIVKSLENEIKPLLSTFLGKQIQTQPAFSAQRVKGKSGFDLAKKNINFELKKNNIEIFTLKILQTEFININEIESNIKNKISKIPGNFRQKEILKNWEQSFEKLKFSKINELPIITLNATVSKRTYIRSLVRDILQIINIPGTTFSITRTKQGIYSKSSCKCIQ